VRVARTLPAMPMRQRVFAALHAVTMALAFALAAAAPAVGVPSGFSDDIAQRMLACTGCHGDQGRSAPDGYHPRIAGKPAGYLYNQLRNFREGRRHYRLMTQLLMPLSDAYLQEIALHFAGLDLPYAAPPVSAASPQQRARGEQLARRGDPARDLLACTDCHGAALTGVLPATPGLLGLPRDYLVAQLGAWRGGTRRAHAPDCMATIARRLAPEDLAAVADWLASQPVPARSGPAAATGGRRALDCCGIDGLPAPLGGGAR